MIYELRTYTVKQGTAPEVAKAAGTVGRDIRERQLRQARGLLGQRDRPSQPGDAPVELRRPQRARAPARRARQEPALDGEYIPLIRPNLIRQEMRLLNAVIAPKAPATTPNVYELRAYRTKPGAGQQWADLVRQRAAGAREVFQDRRPVDHRGGPAQRGLPHLGLSPTSTRARRRVPSPCKDPGWQAFIGRAHRCSTRCTPPSCCRRPHSPLK